MKLKIDNEYDLKGIMYILNQNNKREGKHYNFSICYDNRRREDKQYYLIELII